MAPTFQLFTSLRYDPQLTTLPINTTHWPSDLKTPSPFYMLPHHRDRLLQAAQHFNWTLAASKITGPSGFIYLLKHLTSAVDTTSSDPLRVRVILSYDGSITIETFPTPAVTQWNLYPARIPPPASAAKMTVSPLTGGALEVGSDDSVYGDPPTDAAWEVLPDTAQTEKSPYTTYKTTSRDMYVCAQERVGILELGGRKEVLVVNGEEEVMEGSRTSPYFWREGRWVTPGLGCGGQNGTTRRWALEKGFCGEGVVRVGELVDGEECWISNGVRGFLLGKVKLS